MITFKIARKFMINYTEEIINGINLALNEATILGVEFSKDDEGIAVTFVPIALDENGQIPNDNRVQFIFKPVGKFIASYRLGDWNDADAEVIKFEPEQILQKVQEFGGCPIYGWEFIDCKKESNDNWLNKLSCEYKSEMEHGRQHSIDLFQAGENKHIDIKIWFDEFKIFTPNYEKIDLQTFIENGKRGWDGIYDGTASDKFAIYPSKDYIFPQLAKDAVKNAGIIIESKKESPFSKLWKKIWN